MDDRPVWTRHEIEVLINLYQSKPELWDIKSKDYRDKFKKRQTLIQLAQTFNVTPEEVTRKIHNLRTQFNDALKKTLKRNYGNNSCDVYVSKWPYFKSLLFLRGSSTGPKEYTQSPNEIDETAEDRESESYDEKSVDIFFEQPRKLFKGDANENNDNNDNNESNNEMLKRALDYENNESSEMLQRAMHTTYVTEDHYDLFGKFVASEIKNLPSDLLRRKMKRKIQQVILDINEEAEQYM